MRYTHLFLLLFFVAFAAPAQAEFDACNPTDYQPIAEVYKRGLLFRISKCGSEDSYILGTMHSDLPQVRNAIPKSVWDILGESASASFELKEDPKMQLEIMTAMFYPQNSGQNLRITIGEEMYGKLVQTLEGKRQDLTEAVYEKMRPWAIGVLMQVPPDSHDGVHLDKHLEAFAQQNKVKIYGLESAIEQLSVFTGLNETEQLQFLHEAIEGYAQTEEINDKMLSRYLQRDLTSLQNLAVESFDMMKNVELREKLKTTLITKRNLMMLERMQPRLIEGKAFIAVGALHLPTDQGLLHLLEKQGYYIHVVNK